MNTVLTTAPFLAEHPDVLAVYCSDGRYTGSVEELVRLLGHDRVDVLCVPGGAGTLDAWTCGSGLHAEHAVGQLSFLIEKHHTRTVVLVSHEGCGFYADKYRVLDDDSRRERQLRDLESASAALKAKHAGLDVKLYHAVPRGGRVLFEVPR